MVKYLVVILAFVSIIFGTDASAQESPTFLGSGQFGVLFSIDVAEQSATLIGLMPEVLATEIEFDILTRTLWAEESNGGLDLHRIDPASGGSLETVRLPEGALNGMEFVGSVLYGTFITDPQGPSDLVTVDTSSGELTTIGPTGVGPVSGLAYDDLTGVMYGVTAGGNLSDLVIIDLTTGHATVIGPTGFDRIGSIEFGPDGKLYGGLSRNTSSVPGLLLEIDPNNGFATPLFETGFSITGLTATTSRVLPVSLDVKPSSCPNPLNVKSKGVLPVALLGTADFDVNDVDVASLRLEGVSPIRSALEDVATPTEPFTAKEDCYEDCNELEADGYTDLTLKFDRQEIVDALESIEDRECVALKLTGTLVDGTSIEGEDLVVILNKPNAENTKEKKGKK